MVSGWFHGVYVVSWYSGGFMVFRWFHGLQVVSCLPDDFEFTYLRITYIHYLHT